ncbi:PilR protein [Escherichia coli]|nr:PilR protein [Escherichia coli]
MQIMSGRTLEQAMLNIREVYTRGGQRFHPFGVLAQDCLDSLSVNREGNLLPDVFRRWFSGEEAASLAVGMRAGSLLTALDQSHPADQVPAVHPFRYCRGCPCPVRCHSCPERDTDPAVRSAGSAVRQNYPAGESPWCPCHHLRSGGLRHHSRPLGAGYAHCVFFCWRSGPCPAGPAGYGSFSITFPHGVCTG